MPENALELHPQALEDALAGYSWHLEHNEIAAVASWRSWNERFS